MKKNKDNKTADIIRKEIEKCNRKVDRLHSQLQEVQSRNMGFNYSNKDKIIK